MEIELKLLIEAHDLPRLARLALVRRATRGRPTTRQVHSVYYDTPQRLLRHQGYALRLRRDGQQWVQTLKGGGRAEAGLHQREEYDVPVAGQLLDLPALWRSPAGGLLAGASGRSASLEPVFITRFRRTRRILELSPGVEVELCTDQGTISAAGGKEEPLREIELELLAGPPQALLDLALALLEHLPLRLENRSKSQRGYALADSLIPGPVKAGPVTVEASMTVTEAFRRVCFSCVGQLQANESAARPEDWPETLHQARVALRRLRCCFSLFAPAFPREAFAEVLDELRWLSSQLGPARDWDVFAEETLPELRAALPADPAVDLLEIACAAPRQSSRQDAMEALRSRRYTALLLRLQSAFMGEAWEAVADPAAQLHRAEPLQEFASWLLRRRHRKVMRFGETLASLSLEELHELRIAVKKLRYSLEFFLPLLQSHRAAQLQQALVQLQQALGALNDTATAQRLLSALATDERLREAAALMRGFGAAGTSARLASLPAAWKQVRRQRLPW